MDFEQLGYTIIRSRRKTLSLTVDVNARVIIRAPLTLSDKTIKEFISQKSNWIRQKIDCARENKPVVRTYNEGEKIPFLGREYNLCYIEDAKEPVNLQDKLYISLKQRDKIREILIAWYIVQGYQIIPSRVYQLSSRLNLKPCNIKITRAERRWGSCSPKGSLCFSWRLLMAPQSIIDYVIVHELVHLEIRDHSFRFWQKVRNIMPDYHARRKFLKDNERKMYL